MSDPWVSGTHVGKYELLQKLATGGMAEIFLARARGIEGFAKLVVLKRILPQYNEQKQFVQMFLDEARLAARLDHPHIAQVYDIGHVGENRFFTMEFVHGEDARHVVGASAKLGNWLPLEVGLGICAAVASGLHYAHEQRGPDGRPLGIVHRDVSLTNILVSYDGAVKVLDFGIAKAASHTATTLDGTLKGKLAYMSPEQCRGEPLDRRSDVFALGVVLYQLTCMAHPFGAKKGADNDLALLNRIIAQEPQAPSTRRVDIPADLERIILKALKKDPKERYQSALELLEDIETFALSIRLSISAATLRRFMQEHFAGKIEAWRAAEGKGVSLADHIARERQQPTPGSGILSAESLHRLREPVGEGAIPASDDIVPSEMHDTVPQLRIRAKRRWPLVAGGITAVIALVLIIGFTGSDDSTPTPASAADEAARPQRAEKANPSPSPRPSPSPAAAAGPTVTSVAPPGATPARRPGEKAKPAEVTIVLQVDPPGATVELDGVVTPESTLRLPKSDRVHRLVVSAEGYRTLERELRATEDGEVPIKLRKKAKGTRREGRKPSGYVGPMETDL